MSVETWTERAPSGAPERPAAPPRVGRLRPRLGVADTLLHLWRAKWLMLLVFVPILLLGVAFTLLTPAKYTASTRLLVRLGAEYVFDPVVGDAAKGAFPQQEEVLQAEGELARSPAIAERVIKNVGLSRLYPQLAEAKLRSRNGDGYVVDQDALEVFAENLDISSAPKSSVPPAAGRKATSSASTSSPHTTSPTSSRSSVATSMPAVTTTGSASRAATNASLPA